LPTLVVIPDIEKIVSGYLRELAELQDLDARVVGKTPGSTTAPWVRVTKLDAPNVSNARVEHLIAYLVQFDCYAGVKGGQPEANALAALVRAALIALPATPDLGAVVTSSVIVGDGRIPDTDFEPARERVILTATVHMHPTAGA
jgi:hypothetical protein